jgi:hypothetical protein
MICNEPSTTKEGVDRELCARHLSWLPRDLQSEWLRNLPWAGDDLRRRIRQMIAHCR